MNDISTEDLERFLDNPGRSIIGEVSPEMGAYWIRHQDWIIERKFMDDERLNINNMENKISNNFNMSEFAVSVAASAKGHKIVIPENLKPNIIALVKNVLQPICDATGWKDKVNSGYRDAFTNKLVGGADGSQHTKGEAADNMFFWSGTSWEAETIASGYIKIIDVLKKVIELDLDFDQMIAYPTFVHLSYTTSRKNRRQVLYNSSYKGEKL